jgi:hypothetical protein
MAVTFPEGFLINAADPIDSRTVVSSSSERFNFIDPAVLFNGLIVYQQTGSAYGPNGEVYVLVDKSNVGNDNGWAQVDISLSGSGLGLQGTLEGGNSASLGLTASFAHVNEVSFIGSSAIPIKLKKHTTDDSIMVSGSGFVFQPISGTSPTARVGGLMYSSSNFYAGIT